jgi:hypothetical protein
MNQPQHKALRVVRILKRLARWQEQANLGLLILLTGVIASPAATAHLGNVTQASQQVADTQPAPVCASSSTGLHQLPTDYIFHTLRTCTLELEAGRQYRWSARWEGTATTGSLMGARVEAYPLGATSATQRARSTLATRNHRGDARPAAVGTEWLFSPEQSGTYVIELRAQAGRCDNTSVIRAGKRTVECVTNPNNLLDVIDGANTFLRIASNSYSGGMEWRQAGELPFGLAPRPRAVDAVYRTVQLPAGTTQAHVWAGLGVSVESTGGAAALQTRLTLFVRQVRADGSYCNVATKVTTGTIDGTLHHYRFNPMLDYQMDPACASSRVNVKVYTEYLPAPAGQPVRHGGVVHAEPYSGAHIIPIG